MNRVFPHHFRGRYPPAVNAKGLGRVIPGPVRRKCHKEQAIERLFTGSGTSVRLLSEIGRGGEGVVFETDRSNLVAKVYHDKKDNYRRFEKVRKLIEHRVSDPSFCQPMEILCDSQRVPCGFLMPQVPKAALSLQESVFRPTNLLKIHPNWTRRESTELVFTILEKIQLLHSHGILIGDISPVNILMSDPKTVHLIDCDSFQIDRFPCPVATPLFTPPELQGMSLMHAFRTVEHELFAVAVLLFMIFMPGKGPYSHKGGEEAIANIRKRHFPYSLGEKSSDGAPIGPWRLCWSHLSRKIKTAFHMSFHRDYAGKPRVTIQQWLTILRQYAWFLSQDQNVFQGPARHTGIDLSIMPENFRRVRTEDGRIEPPWRTDGLTDREAMVQRLNLFS